MSPCETSQEEGFLEHPAQAFSHFRSVGISRVVCQEKHMGSRSVVIVCRDEETTRRRFGVVNDGNGTVFTRTGRRFFEDAALEQELVETVRIALDQCGFWKELATDWVCLDCELMPWSAKAQQLLRTQYAAVGSAATASLHQAVQALRATTARRDIVKCFEFEDHTSARPVDPERLLNRYVQRQEAVEKYIDAYRQYCWSVEGIKDLKLAPFHILATEGTVHIDKDHIWHMNAIAKACEANSGMLLLATPYKVVDLTDAESEDDGTKWWLDMTAKGREGMVVKPIDFVMKGTKGLVQPAVKVRGPEYLRLIYGPEYMAKEHIDRLRQRHLGTKRSLALREFALGIEALERFVRREPLRRIHECVFGILALESEPVDPRL